MSLLCYLYASHLEYLADILCRASDGLCDLLPEQMDLHM